MSSICAFFKILVPHDRRRRVALAFAAAATFSFIVNFSFTIWTMTKEATDGVGLIWEGEQTKVKIWNTTMHVVINVISTILLAGSNYCMQCLMAPTRKELDKSHFEGRWLDIGIPTVRNFGSITKRRQLLWILLSISSFPLHLLFNSIIFSSISTNYYYVLGFVEADFLLTMQNASSLPETLYPALLETLYPDIYLEIYPDIYLEILPRLSSDFQNGTMELRNPSACLDDYGTAFQSARGNVILVAGNNTIDKLYPWSFVRHAGGMHKPFDWICTTINSTKPCDESIPDIKGDPESWRPFGHEIKGCYSKPTKEHSKLLFSRGICWIVTFLNLLKSILMFIVAYGDIGASEQPILTVGDAVASYLENPDEWTKHMCLKSKNAFAKKEWAPNPETFDATPQRKSSVISLGRWILCIALCALALGVCCFLLVWGLLRIQLGTTSSMTKYGLGVVHSDTIIQISRANALIPSVLLSNTPQLLMSLVYFNYNALYTCISLATEWDRFSSGNKKGLRVSTKRQGDQRETYFLELPYRYSLPLVVFSGVLHWLISQSIFLVRVEVYDFDDQMVEETTSCGWSPIGAACVIVVGSVLIGFLVASGSRRLRHGGIPVAGSCSAAIAAACHPDPSEGNSLATLPLSWGVVSTTDTAGHCSFTSQEVEQPIEGCPYA